MRYGEHSEFAVIIGVHDRLHKLVNELIKLRVRRQESLVQPQLGQLYRLLEELIARLRELVKRG
jgi:hypothetical protein